MPALDTETHGLPVRETAVPMPEFVIAWPFVSPPAVMMLSAAANPDALPAGISISSAVRAEAEAGKDAVRAALPGKISAAPENRFALMKT